MDASNISWSKVTEILAQPRAQAGLVAVAMLSLIAVLQVQNLDRQVAVRELLTGAQWHTADIQRLQIACSKHGLSGLRIEGSEVFVPSDQHAEYIQAATAENAIPPDLREESESLPELNPFIPSSARHALVQRRKKQQIREMVARLPFVDRAYFEMDQSDTGAFSPSLQSAVVSIHPLPGTVLSDHHVDTVKELIRGAVATLRAEDIVVVNLDDGLVYRTLPGENNNSDFPGWQINFAQQRLYEHRIRTALATYPSLTIQVHVDPEPEFVPDEVALAPAVYPVRLKDDMPGPGANGVVSLDNLPTIDTNQPVNHTEPAPMARGPRVTVSVDVPQALVVSLFGLDTPLEAGPQAPRLTQQQRIDNGFTQLRAELLDKILLQLPPETSENQVSIQLSRQPIAASPETDWVMELETVLASQWPSLMVLVLGLVLMTVVTRRRPLRSAQPQPVRENEDHDVLSIESGTSASVPEPSSHELTQLIEDDPDAAAMVIESWIRDAA